MKPLLIGLLAASTLLVSTAASADPYYWRGHYHGRPVIVQRSGPDWVFPMIGGVIVGAVIADAAKKEQQTQQPVVVVPQQPVVIAPGANCTAWKEIQTGDGTIYRERFCTEGR